MSCLYDAKLLLEALLYREPEVFLTNSEPNLKSWMYVILPKKFNNKFYLAFQHFVKAMLEIWLFQTFGWIIHN